MKNLGRYVVFSNEYCAGKEKLPLCNDRRFCYNERIAANEGSLNV